jgi:hypothetical protein
MFCVFCPNEQQNANSQLRLYGGSLEISIRPLEIYPDGRFGHKQQKFVNSNFFSQN